MRWPSVRSRSNETAHQLNDAYTEIEKGTGITSDRLDDMTKSLTVQRQQMGRELNAGKRRIDRLGERPHC